ncbi:hypothetical protein MTYP_01743 [Methylophilaceae bacterium]|nr:hypothetical protein MTYP_01743 [Methylophilaceae bacterium]
MLNRFKTMNKPVVVKDQRGSVLLEGLISILIFSMGILAIVGLQASAIKTVADSQYRLEASYLANQVISNMWTNVSAINTFSYPGGSAEFLTDWINEVEAKLPGSDTNEPTVVVSGDATDGYTATITLFWKAPGETNSHNYTAVAYINANP